MRNHILKHFWVPPPKNLYSKTCVQCIFLFFPSICISDIFPHIRSDFFSTSSCPSDVKPRFSSSSHPIWLQHRTTRKLNAFFNFVQKMFVFWPIGGFGRPNQQMLTFGLQHWRTAFSSDLHPGKKISQATYWHFKL